MSKRSTLTGALRAAAGKPALAAEQEPVQLKKGKESERTVLIGAHFAPEVRRVLLLVQAQPENEGKNLKELLGEAINDLCIKYRQPQPYGAET